MVEQVATGVVGRAACEKDTVLMLHHTGVRKNFQAFATSVEADTAGARQWISEAYADLPYVPCRLVAKNVTEQRKWKFSDDTGELQEAIKLRVTTDDGAEAGEPGVAPASHNNSLPRERSGRKQRCRARGHWRRPWPSSRQLRVGSGSIGSSWKPNG